MTIRKEIEAILELKITDWSDVFRAAEVQGKLTGARINKIIRVLCEKVEQLEKNE